MTQGEFVAVVESSITLAVIVVLMLRLWPSHRVDEFRQSLFVVRDELFDFAASGAISFNDPAYRLQRQLMNGFIRYGHQLTLFRLVCNSIRWNLHGEQVFSWASKWDAAIKNIQDENVKKDLLAFQAKTLGIVVKRLVTGSPLLLALLAALIVGAMAKSQWVSLRQLAKKSAEGMVIRLFDQRFLEEEASRA